MSKIERWIVDKVFDTTSVVEVKDAQGLVPVSNIAPNLSNVVGMFVLPNVSPSA